jgi:ABC-2 type transport system permease protein
VMYALQDYIGEEAVNRALASYLAAVKFQGPPYTNSVELLGHLRKEVPPELSYLIADLFETITLHDHRALSATYRKTADGRYEVKLKTSSRKLRADDQGAEREVPVDDLVDVGVVDEQGVPVVLERRHVKAGETEFSLVVDRLPVKAGIDPLNKLIDRRPKDNLVRVVAR